MLGRRCPTPRGRDSQSGRPAKRCSKIGPTNAAGLAADQGALPFRRNAMCFPDKADTKALFQLNFIMPNIGRTWIN